MRKKKFKLPSTSKILMAFLFLNCTAVEIFTGWITVYDMILSQRTMNAPDFAPLTTLIGAIIGETIGFAIYSIKAAKENCKGGIVYEQALNNSIEEEQIDVDDECEG